MRRIRIALPNRNILLSTALTALLVAPVALPMTTARAEGQAAPMQSPPPPPPAQAYPDDSWVPHGMEALGQHSSFHTEFTFDKSMLEMANGFVGDDETQRVVAKLRGISVHTFRYPAPGMYDPAILESVRQQYRDRGWQHLVATQSHAAAPNPDSQHRGHTDVWVRFAHGNVEGVVLLVTNETNVNLVAVNGTISPLDLLHLRGHFGIPKFSGDSLHEDNQY